MLVRSRTWIILLSYTQGRCAHFTVSSYFVPKKRSVLASGFTVASLGSLDFGTLADEDFACVDDAHKLSNTKLNSFSSWSYRKNVAPLMYLILKISGISVLYS